MNSDALKRLVIATRNSHKAGEIQTILGKGFQCRTLRDFPDAPEVIEDAATFAGNATKKAVELARWLGSEISNFKSSISGAFVLADDSGLEVDALNGAPGVFSARFAAMDSGAMENSTDAANNAKLLRLLENVPLEKRTARFRCVLALAPLEFKNQNSEIEISSPVCYADELELRTEIFDGACEGRIEFAPRGQGGFGYDPLFVPVGFEKSFAELGDEIKNRLSHRAKALEKLKARFNSHDQ
ncbi:MAG TPA: non-canonical purine NTP pyrophosphatase [Verrucomicrobiae bacterium]|nr:non-canonical purine NTP pyrophosphatase [Verrucomicrobiae bacterium]